MKHPDYGIDAPHVIRNLLMAGIPVLLLSSLLPVIHFSHFRIHLGAIAVITGVVLVSEAILMFIYSKWGKLNHRERMLDLVSWQGNEKVLDIGTGKGLLMIGAAKRLKTGKSIGIDIWNAKDLSNNNASYAYSNAEMEGVIDKIEILDKDILSNGFAHDEFEVVLSNLCLHNIYNKSDREKACLEIYRILKPGGAAIISDFSHSAEYSREFTSCGMKMLFSHTYYWDTFPPLTIIKFIKS